MQDACMEGISSSVTASGGKAKVVVVMGATATGKSKLAVDLALLLGGEVINSDKIQVHDGLDVVTNKVTVAERKGVPHHLIGGVSPDADYTAADFCRDATRAVESVLARGRVPIIAGGSNRYIAALLDGEPAALRRRYECCLLCVGADLPVLDRYILDRVDSMLEQGLVDEVRPFFRPDGDYSGGVRRAIGVPEMHEFFRQEAAGALDGDDELRARLLAAAADEIKANTCRLARRQMRKIQCLRSLHGWSIRCLDATGVLALKVGDTRNSPKAAEGAAWEKDVVGPAARFVGAFLAANNTIDKQQRRFVSLPVKDVVAAAGGCTAAEWWGRLHGDTAVVSPGRGLVGLDTAVV